MEAKGIKVLLLENDASHAKAIRCALQSSNAHFIVRVACSLREYRDSVAAGPPDIALLNMVVPGGRSLELVSSPPEANPFPILMMASYGDEKTAVEAMKAGALDYVVKSPQAFAVMPRILSRALDRWQLLQERRQAEEARRVSEQDFHLLAAYHKQLNDISISFIEASDLQNLFDRITETFRLLTGAIASSFSVYNQEARDLKVVSLSIDPTSRDKVSSIFGPESFEMRMPVSAEVMQQMLGEVIRRPKDLHELSFGVMPQDISDAVMDAVGCRQIVALAINYAEELVGTCIAYLPEDQPVVPDDALKTYSYMSGLTVKRRRAEEALKTSEAQYRLLSEHTTDSVWLMDMNLKTTYHSPSVEKIRGFTPLEIMELPLEQNLTPQSLKLASAMFLEELPRIEANTDYNPVRILDLEYYCKDGTTAWAENKFSVIRDQSGKAVSIMGESRDITERRQVDEALKTSEAQYRLLSEHMTDTVWLMDMNLKLTYHSPSQETLRGLTHQEIIEIPLEQTLTPESLKIASELAFQEIPRVEADPDYNPIRILELEYYRKDGTTVWAEIKFSIIRDGNGKAVSILGEGRDISERKQAEQSLRESEARYRLLSEHMTDTIFLLDMDLKMTYHSPSGEKLRGFTPREIMEMPLDQTLTPESLKLASELFLEEIPRIETDPGYNPIRILDLEYSCKDSTTVWAESKFSIIRDGSGKAVSILGEGRDITDRKKAEEALRTSEARFKSIVEHITDIFFMLDSNHEMIYISPQVEQALGYTMEEVRNNWRNYMTDNPINLAAHEKTQLAFTTGEKQPPYLQEFMHRDGTKRLTEINESPLKNDKGEVIGIVGAARDITERKRAESALKESEEKYRLLVENALESIVIVVDGEVKFANSRTAELTGYSLEELTSRSFIDVVHPDDKAKVIDRHLRRLKGEDIPNIYSVRVVWKSGEIRWAEISAALITWEGRQATLNFLTDVTDRQRLEEERQRVAKLESVGLLAGGIAHDFNNILTSIMGNIGIARMEAASGNEIQNSLEQAEKASLRAKDLTLQLLTFSKGGAPVTKLASLTELLKDAADFALSGSTIKCYFSIPSDLWLAEIDEGQVSQIIHNLVINGQQAMPAGGSIEISAENIALSKTQSLGKGLPIKAGHYIRITVADHGSGIPAEHLARIFDPYFTTKQTGSGLGLATSFSIARNHGGHLSVKSEVGAGSTFYLYLPASLETVTQEQEREQKQDRIEAIKPAGKIRILVMDDEQGMREIAGRMLKHLGYEDVEFAADGAAAIKLYKAALKAGNPFSVAILDLTIPGGMGGQEAVKKLLKIDPGVKAIVSSGYIDDSVIAEYRKYGFCGMMAKPYSLQQLRKALRDVIG
jgi:PAS domain S-box-containing protein